MLSNRLYLFKQVAGNAASPLHILLLEFLSQFQKRVQEEAEAVSGFLPAALFA